MMTLNKLFDLYHDSSWQACQETPVIFKSSSTQVGFFFFWWCGNNNMEEFTIAALHLIVWKLCIIFRHFRLDIIGLFSILAETLIVIDFSTLEGSFNCRVLYLFALTLLIYVILLLNGSIILMQAVFEDFVVFKAAHKYFRKKDLAKMKCT